MITKPSVVLEPRDARQLLSAILARRAGYTPEWLAPEKSAGAGLAAIASRYLETIAQRLNQAPDKDKLAFYDLAGLSLIPAQEARAAVVFRLSEQASGGSAPARTPISAQPPGAAQAITFETEQAVGVTAGKIVQVVSLWPGRDEYIDHSEAFLKGNPIQLFAAALRQPTPHQLFLSHSVLLALAGNVELSIEFELTHGASEPLEIIWEFWDGKVWRGFLSTSKECLTDKSGELDSTSGLTASGHYVLKADCAQADKTKVNGIEGYWLRGRLTEVLPPDEQQTLPEVEAIRIASTVNRALQGRLRVSEPAAPRQESDVAFTTLAAIAPSPNTISGTVSNEAGQPVKGAIVHLISPSNPGRFAFTSQSTDKKGHYSIQNVNFSEAYLYQVAYAGMEFSGPAETLKPKERPSTAKPVVDLMLSVEGLKPDKAFADSTALDVSKPFYPLGQQPQPGAAFLFTNEEAFTKPGAKVRMYVARTLSPQDESSISTQSTELPHLVNWEYWNGRQWAPLATASNLDDSTMDLNGTEVIDFTVPIDMALLSINGEEARWVRMRLQSGSYGFKQEVTFQTGNGTSRFTQVVAQPPVLAAAALGYTWQYGPFHPDTVLSYNDFHYKDATEAAIWPGLAFLPFERVSDVTPAIYFGFDKKPPEDQLGMFFDAVETPGDTVGPALLWEYWDGFEWRALPADDETGNLRRPGIVNLLAQSDDTPLDRFGKALNWIRARLKEDGPPGEPTFDGVYPNAVWALERHTVHDVPIGASNGTPNQVFTITQVPILPGETIEVRELAGARANVEWRILAMELFQGDGAALQNLEAQLAQEGPGTDIVRSPLRLRRNRQKQVTEAWVLWESRKQLFFSGPEDRHYALDRATGRLYFGDGINGRVAPAGSAILIREMTSGGGSRGNVPASSIKQLLGVVPGIQDVFNPRAAEGGADGESLPAALERCPHTIRHRGRAIDAGDYETLAREASPAAAIVRAIPGRNPAGVHLPGWVTLLVVPYSQEPRPYPSFGMREQIRKSLEQRAPADLAGLHRIQVTGPKYRPVDVAATIVAVDPSQSGIVEKNARARLEHFLHPLFGGPAGEGWDLGRDVFLSDIAAELERTEGLDFVEELALLSNGVPQGESLAVAEDEIVCAGSLTFKLKEAPR